MALTQTLQDDFQWGTLDTGKWSTALSADPTQINETNLYLNVTHAAAFQYNTYSSLTAYDLTSSYFYVNVLDAGNQSLASHEAILQAYLDVNNKMWFTASGGNLSAFKLVGGVQAQVGVSIAYSASTHAWWRFRESGGTIFWDTSADGNTWTNRWSVANPFVITAINPCLVSGCYASEASGSYANFTNFNLAPHVLQFAWMGQTWNKRIQTGPSMYNNQWSAVNVSGPDSNGYLNFSLVNNSNSPVGAEVFSAKRGWGYGEYICTLGTEIDNLLAPIVWGGMFTFDFTRPPYYAEIDMGEYRYYNGSPYSQVLFSHTYNNGGSNTFVTDNYRATNDKVRTLRCIWTPTSIDYYEYAGSSVNGPLLNHVTHTTNIPTTSLERVHFNLWVQNLNNPTISPNTTITLQSFSFNPSIPVKDYKRRIYSHTHNLAANIGYAVDPVHVPNGGVTNWEVCPAGSVIKAVSVNVAPVSGKISLRLANGDPILNQNVLSRDYKEDFYCPQAVFITTPGKGEDITVYVVPPSKGNLFD